MVVRLDPTFAMSRLRLGLLARRAGDREAAQRELSQAMTLLEVEDPVRLLLFGGGFSREALIGLCSSSYKKRGERR
jgi:chemotaxis protein methyltransferase CheR